MNIRQLLSFALEQKASDLHISSGLPPMLRIDGHIHRLNLAALDAQQTQNLLDEVMNEEQRHHFTRQWSCDFAFDLEGVARFRVNVFQQARGMSGVFRIIAPKLLSLKDLQAPRILYELCQCKRGLVLVTGPTGCGKSTTLAAMIDEINQQQPAHILTIEDPIEFLHQSKQSLIQQREVYRHTPNFTDALHSALREDPDVILIGELRDLATIQLALSAAETGHLVLATLHTASAAQTINRILDVFPGNEKSLIRSQLSESLLAVISQSLHKKTGGGRMAAYEILLANTAVRNLIREDKIAQIPSVIQTSNQIGMQTLEQARHKLIEQGLIEADPIQQ